MIIVMEPSATDSDVQQMVDRVEEAGLEAILLRGEVRKVIAAIGDKREAPIERWQGAPGVERIIPILSPYKLASREAAPGATAVRLDGQVIGQRKVQVIAGPCAVEDFDQTLRAAEAVKAAGAVALRGGAYKPRTSPHSFQGLEEEGLVILREVGDRTGLVVVTEVLSPEQVALVAGYADVLQIGARNMQNFMLLKEVGKVGKPVLLKRGISASVDEFLLAAEYVLKGGNSQVILCCRGIRTFEDHTRFTLDLGTAAYLKQVTHLPVIVDPSHGTGVRSLVAPMAKAAVAAGADGLIIEVHPEPERALVDGPQTLSCEDFARLMRELQPVAEAVGRTM